MKKQKIEFDETRGGYGFRYFFNAGLNKKTLVCDEEGTDVFDEDTGEFVGQIVGVSPDEIIELTEEDFEDLLIDNDIM